MSEVLATLTGVSKTYQKAKQNAEVLHKLDIAIPKGAFIAIMGPSGSGKTTLLNRLGGLDKPTSGTVRVRIGFLERDDRIMRDMGVKVSFLGSDGPSGTVAEVQGVMIPGAALRSDENGDFVWIVRNADVERRSVELGGPRDRPQILIKTGLVAGDSVVRTSSAPLSPGQSVKTTQGT